jgi:hypothetical protein
MRTVFIRGACAAALLVAGACSKGGGGYEGTMQKMLGQLNELSSVLEGVKDEASAKAAKPKLQKIGAEMQELKKQVDAMKKPTKEEEDALKKKYEPQMKDAVAKLMKESMRVAMVPGGADLMKEMQNFKMN